MDAGNTGRKKILELGPTWQWMERERGEAEVVGKWTYWVSDPARRAYTEVWMMRGASCRRLICAGAPLGRLKLGRLREREVSGLEHVSAREGSFLSFSLYFFPISCFQISNSKVDLNEIWMSNLIQMLSKISSMPCKFYFIYWLIYSPRQILYIYES